MKTIPRHPLTSPDVATHPPIVLEAVGSGPIGQRGQAAIEDAIREWRLAEAACEVVVDRRFYDLRAIQHVHHCLLQLQQAFTARRWVLEGVVEQEDRKWR